MLIISGIDVQEVWFALISSISFSTLFTSSLKEHTPLQILFISLVIFYPSKKL